MSEAGVESSQTKAAAPPQRILVVDDVEANRDSLARRLVRRGYAVEMAEDGEAALRLLGGPAPFDLVLLDIMMPGLSGLEVLDRLRQTHAAADLPVVMASAKGESEDVVAAMTRGANDYVTKPFDFPVVLARVQTQLSLKASMEEVRRLERELSERNASLQALNDDLRRTAERTQRDLSLGARVQASMLPNRFRPTRGLDFAWAFRPCEHLAGDALNICPIAAGVAGVYVLDVVGHGVASSLLSVAAMRALGNGRSADSMLNEPDGSPTRPAAVAEQLNKAFPFNAETGQYFTFFYALVEANADRLTYVSAGHPGAILLPPGGGEPVMLDRNGTPIGIGGGHEDHAVAFAPGSRLVLYSDGVSEAVRAGGERYDTARLAAWLQANRALPLAAMVDALLAHLDAWRDGEPSHDDVTILAVERV